MKGSGIIGSERAFSPIHLAKDIPSQGKRKQVRLSSISPVLPSGNGGRYNIRFFLSSGKKGSRFTDWVDERSHLTDEVKEPPRIESKKKIPMVKVYLVFTTSHFPWLTINNCCFAHIRGFFKLNALIEEISKVVYYIYPLIWPPSNDLCILLSFPVGRPIPNQIFEERSNSTDR